MHPARIVPIQYRGWHIVTIQYSDAHIGNILFILAGRLAVKLCFNLTDWQAITRAKTRPDMSTRPIGWQSPNADLPQPPG
jgi:hypothetical protein